MRLFGNDRITMNYNEIVREKQQHRQKILLFPVKSKIEK
jgi:hypothetical protein